MTDKENTLHRILTGAQTGTIVSKLSELLNISPYDAFRKFFSSETYARFRQPRSMESMLGDPALIDLFLEETAQGAHIP